MLLDKLLQDRSLSLSIYRSIDIRTLIIKRNQFQVVPPFLTAHLHHEQHAFISQVNVKLLGEVPRGMQLQQSRAHHALTAQLYSLLRHGISRSQHGYIHTHHVSGQQLGTPFFTYPLSLCFCSLLVGMTFFCPTLSCRATWVGGDMKMPWDRRPKTLTTDIQCKFNSKGKDNSFKSRNSSTSTVPYKQRILLLHKQGRGFFNIREWFPAPFKNPTPMPDLVMLQASLGRKQLSPSAFESILTEVRDVYPPKTWLNFSVTSWLALTDKTV